MLLPTSLSALTTEVNRPRRSGRSSAHGGSRFYAGSDRVGEGNKNSLLRTGHKPPQSAAPFAGSEDAPTIATMVHFVCQQSPETQRCAAEMQDSRAAID